MDIMEIEKLAYLKMKNIKIRGREQGFIYFHGKRVGKIASKIYQQVVETNKQEQEKLLYIGCLFHDVGKGLEPHNETGAEIIKYYLKDLCSPKENETISRIVYEHNRRKYSDVSLLGKIAQDADILDHMGTMDIWIAFQSHAAFDETVDDSLKFFKGGEWEKVNNKLKSLLNFDCSIAAFEQRKKVTKNFIDRLEKENNGEMF